MDLQRFSGEIVIVGLLLCMVSVEKLVNDMVSDMTDGELIEKYGFNNTKDWTWTKSRTAIRGNNGRDKYITKVCYRPFDIKWTYLHKDIIGRPRPLIQSSMIDKENLMLCIGKQGTAIGNTEWSLAYISTLPTDINVNPRGGAYLFPMFIYDNIGLCMYNFLPTIIEEIEQRTGLHIQQEQDKERSHAAILRRANRPSS